MSQPSLPRPAPPPPPRTPQNFTPPAQPTYAPPPSYAAAPYVQPPRAAQGFPQPVYGAAAASPKELKGNGGWLMFLTLTLVMLGPLAQLFLVIIGLIVVGEVHNDVFTGYFMIDSIIRIAFSIISMVIGVRLWNQRPHSVLWTKRFLLFVLMPSAVIGALLPSIMTQAVPGTSVPQVEAYITLFEVASALAFVAYLKNSKRVANTYPAG
jgi:hypothetical protein